MPQPMNLWLVVGDGKLKAEWHYSVGDAHDDVIAQALSKPNNQVFMLSEQQAKGVAAAFTTPAPGFSVELSGAS